jgi:uncharacterized protein YfaT (DUF1175 family)
MFVHICVACTDTAAAYQRQDIFYACVLRLHLSLYSHMKEQKQAMGVNFLLNKKKSQWQQQESNPNLSGCYLAHYATTSNTCV